MHASKCLTAGKNLMKTSILGGAIGENIHYGKEELILEFMKVVLNVRMIERIDDGNRLSLTLILDVVKPVSPFNLSGGKTNTTLSRS